MNLPTDATPPNSRHFDRDRIVLALNSGSSSLKFGLYRVAPGQIDRFVDGSAISIPAIERTLLEEGLPPPEAIGHRIVHGGPNIRAHCLLDDHLLRQLDAAVAYAPLHGPATLQIIRAAQTCFPGLAHVACVDTAFHASMPDLARVLPIPRRYRLEGVVRYGFHGLSCESVVAALTSRPPHQVPERMIIAHLGSGSSVTAVRNGCSIDTSMGLTASGGAIMSTRPGDVDPGMLLYLIREKRLDTAQLSDMIDHRSGLLGISGISGDMRRLHETAPTSSDATLAIEMFCRSVSKQIAGMIASLGGLDLLVFTGGIGEHDAAVRAAICADLRWMGVTVDQRLNEDAPGLISSHESRCRVRVIAAREEERIAWHVGRLLA